MQKLKSLVIKHWPLLIASFALFFLLFRNPYGTRNLISNFEPFPDSFHYVTVARCFISEGTWNLCRSGLQTDLAGYKSSVPEGYSLVLLPGFLLSFDARTFYFTNVALSYLSLLLLYLILKKINKSNLIQALILGITVTSYHFYWLPTLAMAENLLIPLFLLSGYVLLLKPTKKVIVATGGVAASFYFTKFAYVPIAFSLLLTQFFQLVLDKHKKRTNSELLVNLSLLGLPLILLLPFSHDLNKSLSFLSSFFSKKDSPLTTTTNSYFSTTTFGHYFSEYLKILIGNPARFLWDVRPWFQKGVGIFGILGLLTGLMEKKYRPLAFYFILSTITQIIFMSTFYAFDSRYIYTGFFAVLIGFAMMLEHILLQKRIRKLFKKISFGKDMMTVLVTVGLGVIIFWSRLMPIKSQVMINLKYAETPWWYLSIQEYNAFFSNRREEQAQLISLTSPFMIDFFTNNTYVVLPFDEQQDFNQKKINVWGISDEQTLLETYTQKLENGEHLYIADYGIQAAGQFRNTFKLYNQAFTLEKVHEGCYNLCNIYSLSLPNKTQPHLLPESTIQ